MTKLDADTVRRTPAYTFVEAAHYIGLPVSTLRAWCKGQDYLYKGKTKRFQPVIKPDGDPSEGLSFFNLVEAHVLAGIRRKRGIPLPRVREALALVSKLLEKDRPLLDVSFYTHGIDLFIEEMNRMVNVSRDGQIEIRDFLDAHLKRVERDPQGIPIKLYPFTRSEMDDDPMSVEIDPEVAFGRPVLLGRGVPTAVLADRFKAGESITELADDFEVSVDHIEEALRCEFDRQQAA